MVFDILRSHHLAPTQILSDNSQQTWIRWYPALPSARAYPGWHAFGDPVWESDFPTPDGVGCYPAPLIWRGKKYPAPPGQHYRGLPEWFQYGLPSSALATPPIADTCQASAISPTGGVVIGGAAWPAVPVVGVRPCLCAGPQTVVLTPGVVTSAPCACATPATGVAIPGVVTSAPCACATPATEVVLPVQSCQNQTLTSGSIDNLILTPTTTPITIYNLTPVSGGSVITGVVPPTVLTGPPMVVLTCVGPDTLTFVDDSPSSASGNRIDLPPALRPSVTLADDDTLTLQHDPCAAEPGWAVVSCTVGAGGKTKPSDGPGSGPGSGGWDWQSFNDVGSRFVYAGGHQVGPFQVSESTIALEFNNKLLAMPFMAARGGTIETLRVSVFVASSGAGNVRFGVYTNTSNSNLSPASLVPGTDSGDFSTAATGDKIHTLTAPLVLTAGQIYWLAFTTDSNNAGFCGIPIQDCHVVLGTGLTSLAGLMTAGVAGGVGWTTDRTYGPLPATWPGGVALTGNGNIPVVGVTFSA